MRAEVVLLNRNVVIRGDAVGNWGCTVQTIGYNNVEKNEYVFGKTTLVGV
jgi:hypothetical protein